MTAGLHARSEIHGEITYHDYYIRGAAFARRRTS